MTRFDRRVDACLLFVLSIGAMCEVARATDYGDIWWTPAKAGRGLQISQQGTVLLLEFYV